MAKKRTQSLRNQLIFMFVKYIGNAYLYMFQVRSIFAFLWFQGVKCTAPLKWEIQTLILWHYWEKNRGYWTFYLTPPLPEILMLPPPLLFICTYHRTSRYNIIQQRERSSEFLPPGIRTSHLWVDTSFGSRAAQCEMINPFGPEAAAARAAERRPPANEAERRRHRLVLNSWEPSRGSSFVAPPSRAESSSALKRSGLREACPRELAAA